MFTRLKFGYLYKDALPSPVSLRDLTGWVILAILNQHRKPAIKTWQMLSFLKSALIRWATLVNFSARLINSSDRIRTIGELHSSNICLFWQNSQWSAPYFLCWYCKEKFSCWTCPECTWWKTNILSLLLLKSVSKEQKFRADS